MKFRKPKFWDLKKPNLISLFLLPLTFPLEISNFFLNKKSNQKSKNIKSICIGNIYLGGTGKTPTTIEVFNILQNLNLNICTAKKLYKSQFDEKKILENRTNLIIEKERKKIVQISETNNCDLLIFDDGLQDKSMNYDLTFVCFNTENFIGNGLLIPAGPLREKIGSLKKYDGVFLKNDNNDDVTKLEKQIKISNPNIEIFHTSFNINNLNRFDLKRKYLIFSGIGNPENFKKILLKNNFDIVDEMIFPDHFDYSKNIIESIIQRAKQINAKIVTTEKDFVKISNFYKKDIDFLEIELKIKNERKFIDFIKFKLYE